MWSNADPKTKLMEVIENTFLKSHKGQELIYIFLSIDWDVLPPKNGGKSQCKPTVNCKCN